MQTSRRTMRTTLMLAIDNGSTVIARLLLQQDIDVFSEDTLGWTAENYAYKRGLNTICQLIDVYKVDKGIKNSSQNNRNSSPGSDSPGITVSDVSSQTPGDLKTEEQDVIMMSKKERPDGSDYNHQQDESQKRLQQWREKDNSSFRMQMEFRIKDLELQLSKKISQEDSIRAELEKYKQLHQEEVNTTLSLAKQLDK
nr:POTE ankyrin domain family member A-like isoform X3 [Manis javanica]